MTITVEFDDKIRQKIGGAERLDVTATTVHGALIQVARTYPALHMFNCEGELRSILRVTRNGQPAAAGEALAEGDALRLGMG